LLFVMVTSAPPSTKMRATSVYPALQARRSGVQPASHRALMFGGIAGVIVFVFLVGIYAGVTPDTRDLGKDMNMSNLSKKGKDTAPAPAPEKK
jgi:hypothetical protein